MNNEELDMMFELVRKYMNAAIDAGGTWQRGIFESMKDYGFWAEVHYKGEPWHFVLDQNARLDPTKSVDKILVKTKITGKVQFEITEEEFLFLKKRFHEPKESYSVVKDYNLRVEVLKDQAKEWLPKRGTSIIIDGKPAKLVWIDNPHFNEKEELEDLLIRVSFAGEHGTWRRISEIEEIINDRNEEISTKELEHNG